MATSAALLRSVEDLTAACDDLTIRIAAISRVRSYRYRVVVKRVPKEGGVSVSADAVRRGSGAFAAAAPAFAAPAPASAPAPAPALAFLGAAAAPASPYGSAAPASSGFFFGTGGSFPQAAPAAAAPGFTSFGMLPPAPATANVFGGFSSAAGAAQPAAISAGPWLAEIEPPLFDVEEAPIDRAAADVLASLPCELAMRPIADIFNDRLDYGCRSFSDVQRIFVGLKAIVPKFALFEESNTKILPILEGVLHNLGLVRAALERALGALQDAPSTRAEVCAELEVANQALRSAAARSAKFFRREHGQRQSAGKCAACGSARFHGDGACECGSGANLTIGARRPLPAED